MSEQALDLKRSFQLIRQHWRAAGASAALGLVAGAGYAVLQPPVLTSTALVRIAAPKAAFSTDGSPALVAIASSDPVLALAQREGSARRAAATAGPLSCGPAPRRPLADRRCARARRAPVPGGLGFD